MNTTWRQAAQATLHCLTGCALGEILGMVLGSAFGWSNLTTLLAATLLAFTFGYALTTRSLLRTGLTLRAAFGVALAADTLSIAVMEVVDNAVVLLIPSAMAATLSQPLFYWSLALALAVAFLAAWPVNRALMNRGLGHAKAHAAHGHH